MSRLQMIRETSETRVILCMLSFLLYWARVFADRACKGILSWCGCRGNGFLDVSFQIRPILSWVGPLTWNFRRDLIDYRSSRHLFSPIAVPMGLSNNGFTMYWYWLSEACSRMDAILRNLRFQHSMVHETLHARVSLTYFKMSSLLGPFPCG